MIMKKWQFNSGFSIMEAIIIISLFGILAAIAIPSYRIYKQHSQKSLILTNLRMIKAGLKSCIKVREISKCDTPDKIEIETPLDMTVQAHSTAPTTPIQVCFLVEYGNFKGCVDSSGNETTETEINSTSPLTDCNSTTGICVP